MKDEGNLVLGTKKFQEKTKRMESNVTSKNLFKIILSTKKNLDLKRKLVLNRKCPNCKKTKNFYFLLKIFLNIGNVKNVALFMYHLF